MSNADIWMPLYIGDYLADTARLTTEQHGAYLLLMMDYWRNGAPPDDDEILQNIARLSKFLWKKNRPILEKFFKVKDGLWTHKRIDKEMSEVLSGKEIASVRGKKGAEARWSKSIAQSNAQALLNTCPSQSQSQSPIKAESKASAPSKKILLDADGAWRNIPDVLMAKWALAYPALNLDAELAKAAAWIIANPKNIKSNYARFLGGWLSRVQDRALTPRTSHGPAGMNYREEARRAATASIGLGVSENDGSNFIDAEFREITEPDGLAIRPASRPLWE